VERRNFVPLNAYSWCEDIVLEQIQAVERMAESRRTLLVFHRDWLRWAATLGKGRSKSEGRGEGGGGRKNVPGREAREATHHFCFIHLQ